MHICLRKKNVFFFLFGRTNAEEEIETNHSILFIQHLYNFDFDCNVNGIVVVVEIRSQYIEQICFKKKKNFLRNCLSSVHIPGFRLQAIAENIGSLGIYAEKMF